MHNFATKTIRAADFNEDVRGIVLGQMVGVQDYSFRLKIFASTAPAGLPYIDGNLTQSRVWLRQPSANSFIYRLTTSHNNLSERIS